MIGRGLLANPALLSDKQVTRALIRDFHEKLFERYSATLGGEYATVGRMKEIWLLMSGMFMQDKKYIKRMQQCKTAAELNSAALAMICELPLRSAGDMEIRSDTLP
jgi:tRNA-dihydrouridine synthase